MPQNSVEQFDPSDNSTAAVSAGQSITPVQHLEPNKRSPHIIVIGSGPVGIRFAQELLKRQPLANISVLGNEPSRPYNRVQLSALLAGDIHYDDILTPLPSSKLHPHFSLSVCTIRHIDTLTKTLTDTEGHLHHYDTLVIATGSRPHIPNITGVEQAGVFSLRKLSDAEALYSRMNRARHLVVVGGGLLGIEAARALQKAHTQITLVQQGPWLMNRQLDETAAHLLQQKIEALGIRVITDSGLGEIHGNGRVTGVSLRSGEKIACDTVVICAGIKANLEIAREAKIVVGRGIVVDEQMRTSARDIYAIGECCEFRGSTYGLVNPGFEQAAIAAEIISGGQARYLGSLEISRLKVMGEFVCSMGNISELLKRPHQKELGYRQGDTYRKLVIHRGRLIGALAVGDWSEQRLVQDAYQQQRRLWFWQQWRFLFTGKLWNEQLSESVVQWPRAMVVCQCNNIQQGQLADAVLSGCNSVAQLQAATGAGTVCGSCKPLLTQLTGGAVTVEKDKAWLPILLASLLALCVALVITLMPAAQVSDSVQTAGLFEKIWNNKGWKQVTGFSVLTVTLLGLLMSLRKHWLPKKWGDYAWWRMSHVILGFLCVAILIVHTGFHFGENLNQLLMINFMLIVGVGTLAGVLTAFSHKLTSRRLSGMRRQWNWLHIVLTWPLPALLITHIVSVYFF